MHQCPSPSQLCAVDAFIIRHVLTDRVPLWANKWGSSPSIAVVLKNMQLFNKTAATSRYLKHLCSGRFLFTYSKNWCKTKSTSSLSTGTSPGSGSELSLVIQAVCCRITTQKTDLKHHQKKGNVPYFLRISTSVFHRSAITPAVTVYRKLWWCWYFWFLLMIQRQVQRYLYICLFWREYL